VPRSLRERVELLGLVSDADKPRVFASGTVYCAPNTHGESFGIVLVEAMAAGVPVVASDLEAFRRVLQDGRAGCSCPVRDPGALAGRSATCCTTSPAARRARAAARRASSATTGGPSRRRCVAVYETVTAAVAALGARRGRRRPRGARRAARRRRDDGDARTTPARGHDAAPVDRRAPAP
jgi:phosphatidylinositol alpha-mannosyltransferase